MKGDIGLLLAAMDSQLFNAHIGATRRRAWYPDVPSEAELTPQLWGRLAFTASP